MFRIEMELPRICLNCPFQADECTLSHRMITEEDLYNQRPDSCWLTPAEDGWLTLDYDKIPDGTVVDLGVMDNPAIMTIEEIKGDE